MGFLAAKRLLIENLENLSYLHYEDRPIIWLKNKLFMKEVSIEFVLDKINKCTGDDDIPKPGCELADDNCMHEFKKEGWYIKYFLSKGVAHIVSVHEDDHYV